MADAHELGGWDIEGPVRAEIFLVCLDDDRPSITGPDGARPWIVQLTDAEHPVEVVERILSGLVGPPVLVHSTSWRRHRSAVILTFLAVIDAEHTGDMETAPISRAELARSEATRAPKDIGPGQVLEHGLRHLAWLVHDDPVVAARLTPAWKAVLDGYVPEPFRSFA